MEDYLYYGVVIVSGFILLNEIFTYYNRSYKVLNDTDKNIEEIEETDNIEYIDNREEITDYDKMD